MANPKDNNFSIKERIEYHLKMSKVGAKYPKGSQFAGQELSDFARGQHAAKAKALIGNKRKHNLKNFDVMSDENKKNFLEAELKRVKNKLQGGR